MLNYLNTGIVFQEIPDEVTLSINITGCPCHCGLPQPISVGERWPTTHSYGARPVYETV
mgnify:CR=1 FL=1